MAAMPDMPNNTNHALDVDARAANAGRRNGLIVYIEDNPANVALMHDLVSDLEGAKLLTAPTAEVGIELVRAYTPDVVIVDIHLPGMSGFEATQRLRAWPETRGIPVIALSGAAIIGEKRLVEQAGFYCYVTKPLNVVEFAAMLERLLPPPRTASAS
jgi:CheY-like chemotaxis protein